MFVYKKPEPAVYQSEATGAMFKFRQSSAHERQKLDLLAMSEDVHNNNKNLHVSIAMDGDDYYAGWLMEDFQGVHDESGKSHAFASFTLADRAGLAHTLKGADSAFAAWFASHCEEPEKKIEEAAPSERVVGASVLPAVQG